MLNLSSAYLKLDPKCDTQFSNLFIYFIDLCTGRLVAMTTLGVKENILVHEHTGKELLWVWGLLYQKCLNRNLSYMSNINDFSSG